ncbi:aromatic amino acid ammonia-lyase [Amycolatopsis sp. PS_44_ISF1]|uniref:HAL/PAL/TAL family ammonia-lyase n=1 Tax=Amycolatopsis sp. PS_44_ISF1 TaxID=2974917 RepID=UPI0028DE958D|nr:aromatic amino acid ammonia-lyase [Amycolatopsis sp. PS_44_ISF1]MDT8913874.1 aromatic amino acid ammonia-lyase [Amycolatopsis sp. PS_44_ISF1]
MAIPTEQVPQLRAVRLDGRTLTLGDIVALARTPELRTVVLGEDATERIGASNSLKHRLIDSGTPIYGVTSGFGDSNRRQVSKRKTSDLQDNLVRFLSAGVGPLADPEVVRATMVVRANCLARGHSGVRPELVAALIDLINADVLPMIPERGTVGASGDLVPLSYLAAALTGQGRVLHRGTEKPAAEAFAATGLTPLELEAKEGLAMVNGTSFMSGFAVLALQDAAELAFAADLCTAMTSQVLVGNPGHFAAFLAEAKPHDGVLRSAAVIRSVLFTEAADDGVRRPEADYVELERPIQDPYSVRCAPHVTGVLRDTTDWARHWLTVEVNSANDNPLFDVAVGTVRNGGNFYGGHVAQAMDALKTAVAGVGDLLDRQLELVVDEKFNNGLTPNLIPHVEDSDYEAGLFHGFKGMQIVASSLAAEALKWTMPAASFSRSTEAHNQDKVSMGTIAARDARSVVHLVQRITAIHLIALCQAADLRGHDVLSAPTAAAHGAVREVCEFLDRDRPMDADIERVTTLIARGELRAAVELYTDGSAW